jgi:GxxExxY protein
MPIVYDGNQFEKEFLTDLIIEAKVIAELKSAYAISPIHSTQVLTLRLSGLKLGLLINFGEAHLKDGIKRLIDGRLEEENPSGFTL